MLGALAPADLSHLQTLHAAVRTVTDQSWRYIQAISAGAVLFGSMTYIGNGPNFMVKSIAEQAKVKMPTFLGYMIQYSLPVLLPVFAAIWYIFFR